MAKEKSHFGIVFKGYNYKDKEQNVYDYVSYMMDRTLQMFDWSNLPNTIPTVNIEKMLQTNGYCFFTQVDGSFYVFTGGLGGEVNVYGEPTTIIVSNPALKLNKTFNLETDGVLIRNDSLCMGLLPLLYRYCTMLNENDVTMIMNSFVARVQVALSATDNATVASAERFLQKLERGDFGVIADDVFFNSLKSTPFSSGKQSGTFGDLVQYSQYIRATMFNEIGLNANFNMKRESLTKNEVEMNSDNLYPLVDNMLHQRRLAIEKINAMYGLTIGVEFSSSWDYRVLNGEEIKLEQIDAQLDAEHSEQDTPDDTETTPDGTDDDGKGKPTPPDKDTLEGKETASSDVDESWNESSLESDDESKNESEDESKDESENESRDESENESSDESGNESGDESDNESGNESSLESNDESESSKETPPEDAQDTPDSGDDGSKGKDTAEVETPPEGKETGTEDDDDEKRGKQP